MKRVSIRASVIEVDEDNIDGDLVFEGEFHKCFDGAETDDQQIAIIFTLERYVEILKEW